MSLNPVYRVTPLARASAYLVGGLGVAHIRQEFTTKPSTQDAPLWEALFLHVGRVERGAVLYSTSGNRLDANLGLGVERRMNSAPTAHWYVEARYQYLSIEGIRNTFVPVVLGLRF